MELEPKDGQAWQLRERLACADLSLKVLGQRLDVDTHGEQEEWNQRLDELPGGLDGSDAFLQQMGEGSDADRDESADDSHVDRSEVAALEQRGAQRASRLGQGVARGDRLF